MGIFDITDHMWITTPDGKQVDFIKADVLDEIKTEIKALTDGAEPERIWNVDALAIIDKYKVEG